MPHSRTRAIASSSGTSGATFSSKLREPIEASPDARKCEVSAAANEVSERLYGAKIRTFKREPPEFGQVSVAIQGAVG